jgi:flagellar protein FliS
MSNHLQHSYLESRVLTASSDRLHLMLIEGAIRFGRQAEAALERGDMEAAEGPLMRTLDVVGEMLVGVREMKSDLNRQIANLYLYLFRIIGEAKVHDDVTKLTEALRLLEFERETWQLAHEKNNSTPLPPNPAPHGTPMAAKPRPSIAPHFGNTSPISSLGISLEA